MLAPTARLESGGELASQRAKRGQQAPSIFLGVAGNVGSVAAPLVLRLCGHGLGLDGLRSVKIIDGTLRVGGGLEDGALVVL